MKKQAIQIFIPFKNENDDLSVIHWKFDSMQEFRELIQYKRDSEKKFDFKTDRQCRVIDENGARDEWLSNLMAE